LLANGIWRFLTKSDSGSAGNEATSNLLKLCELGSCYPSLTGVVGKKTFMMATAMATKE